MTWLSKFVITFVIVIACQALGLITWLVHFTPAFNGWFLLLLYPALLFFCIGRIVSFYNSERSLPRLFTSLLAFVGLFAWLVMGLSITVIFINGFYSSYYGKYYAAESGRYFYFYQDGILGNETRIATKDARWPLIKAIPAMEEVACSPSKIMIVQAGNESISFVACDTVYTYNTANGTVTRQLNNVPLANARQVGHIEVSAFPVSLRSVW